MKPDSDDHSPVNAYHRENPLVDEKAFEEHINSEHLIKERTLNKIQSALRERSYSSLGASVHSLDASNNGHNNSSVHNSPVHSHKNFHETYNEHDHLGVDDVQKTFFEAIPEPYFQSTDFRRVYVSETTEATDFDTQEACKQLHKCLLLREKYISVHPQPPQDEITFELQRAPLPGILSPSRIQNKNKQNEFRRRAIPPYNVFDHPIPPSHPEYKFRMVEGVFKLHKIDLSNSQQLEEDSTPGLSLSCSIDESTKSPFPSMKLKLPESSNVDNANALTPGEQDAQERCEEQDENLSEEEPLFPTFAEAEEHNALTPSEWKELKSVFEIFSFEEFFRDYVTVNNIITFNY